jgi:hypothetical protein
LRLRVVVEDAAVGRLVGNPAGGEGGGGGEVGHLRLGDSSGSTGRTAGQDGLLLLILQSGMVFSSSGSSTFSFSASSSGRDPFPWCTADHDEHHTRAG